MVVSKNSAYTKLRPESYLYSRSGRNRLTLLGLARPAREQISSTYELSISKCGSAQQRLVECTIHYAYRLPLPHRHTHTHTHTADLHDCANVTQFVGLIYARFMEELTVAGFYRS